MKLNQDFIGFRTLLRIHIMNTAKKKKKNLHKMTFCPIDSDTPAVDYYYDLQKDRMLQNVLPSSISLHLSLSPLWSGLR